MNHPAVRGVAGHRRPTAFSIDIVITTYPLEHKREHIQFFQIIGIHCCQIKFLATSICIIYRCWCAGRHLGHAVRPGIPVTI